MSGFDCAITDHVEAPRERPSWEVYDEIGRQVELADRLGFEHAWFGEHHGHAHVGHVPHPIAYCIHLAARTRRIHLGASVVCVGLHHPVGMAEQIAMLDVISGDRTSIGVGSGSTSVEFAAYGLSVPSPEERRARFQEILAIFDLVWSGEPFAWRGAYYQFESPGLLPRPLPGMRERLWIGANSVDSATMAGLHGYGLQLSNMRTLEELARLSDAYLGARSQASAGAPPPRIAASAPLYVAETDAQARAEFAPALDIIERENRRTRVDGTTGALPAETRDRAESLRFAVGSPETVCAALVELRRTLPYTTINVRPRWAGTSAAQVERSLSLFAREVRPRLV
ncbi:MAG: LLM class flavin-dependent oxidoreductase [Chloroflexi bacterium]|nr:LLM class flavin-dependent oxidoreductase [Chloroflexota bacterium]